MNTLEKLIYQEPIPRVVKVRQRFDDSKLEDPVAVLREKIRSNESYQTKVKPGMKIAVAVGSRGIVHIPEFVKEIIDALKEKGAEPFIFPAMGSHGGATVEGQIGMLATLGVTEESVGAPIRATMETVELGITEKNKLPVVMDKYAAEADGIVIINRIKQHVSFQGPYESGLMKMITIGCGKQKGAQYCHNLGPEHMAENIPEIAKLAIEKKNFIFAVGTVENAYHQTCLVDVLNKDEIAVKEPDMLAYAKKRAPRLWFTKLDVLIMDELGKNISGTGFDTGIVGRYHTTAISGGPSITKIGILDLTEQSHGNANGIGIVDFTTQRLYDKFDPQQTYINALVNTCPAGVKMPMVLPTDRDVFRAAIRTCNIVDKSKVRLVRFKNTIALDVIEVSESLIPEVEANEFMEVISDPYDLPFDENGNLL